MTQLCQAVLALQVGWGLGVGAVSLVRGAGHFRSGTSGRGLAGGRQCQAVRRRCTGVHNAAVQLTVTHISRPICRRWRASLRPSTAPASTRASEALLFDWLQMAGCRWLVVKRDCLPSASCRRRQGRRPLHASRRRVQAHRLHRCAPRAAVLNLRRSPEIAAAWLTITAVLMKPMF